MTITVLDWLLGPERYIVQRVQGFDVAWLVIPDADPTRAYFDPDKTKATPLRSKMTAEGYCLDDTTTVVDLNA